LSNVVRFAIAAVLAVVVSALLTSCAVTSTRTDARATLDDRTDEAIRIPGHLSETTGDTLDPDEADETIDLSGNPVTSAVAKYKFDATGSLYEVHSPQTELPRLVPPKS